MYAQKKVLNPQVFLEFVCYVTFAVLIFDLVSTGKYQSYVTPKMVPYFYFTVAVMAIWALGGLSRLFRPQHKTRTAHCFVLAIPIMLLLLPHTPINTSDLSSGYLSGNAFSGLVGKNSYGTSQGPLNKSYFNAPTSTPTNDRSAGNTAGVTPSTDTPVSDNRAAAPSDATVSNTQSNVPVYTVEIPPGLDAKNKKITVQDDYFKAWLSELFVNTEKYEGYQISIKGFVFKDPKMMKTNEFVAARLMMSCCTADLAPCGLICKYDKASELKSDTWVTVEGVIHKGKYMDNDEPQITVTKISPAEKVEGYIYP